MTTTLSTQPIEKKVYFALKQLYQLERLKELNGPKALEEAIVRQLKDSHAALGDEIWGQVHKLYPSFRDEQREKEAKDREWEEKCEKCEHWEGTYTRSDLQHCSEYRLPDITKPLPCPKFKLKVLN